MPTPARNPQSLAGLHKAAFLKSSKAPQPRQGTELRPELEASLCGNRCTRRLQPKASTAKRRGPDRPFREASIGAELDLQAPFALGLGHSWKRPMSNPVSPRYQCLFCSVLT